ncbi:hypothetical protein LAJ19_11970 [Deinococcus taeanensis]|uniref:hypothetical protein n=1 Tax=Deinococcus taeanensis TaxID=2737050 RepID=UPI001CDD6244|nr:hypothetical protein [Deinococcus taeanensis]UBV42334.1 hypothetical protein LAJ19_11970 [Deinococcus taeanensis]
MRPARTLLPLLPLLGWAAAVTVTPGPAAPRVIPAGAVSGFNLGNWMPVVEALPALQALRPALLRWPGGNIGDEQDLTRAALQTLKTNWTLLGEPDLIVQTRVFTRGGVGRAAPEDAAQAARDARDLGLRVAYWEIGNEPDLYATNRSDPSWTPARYCAAVAAQRAALLAVDPHARVAGPATSNPGPFLDEVIRQCGASFDLITYHLYPTDGAAAPDTALASAARVTASAGHLREVWADPQRNPTAPDRSLELAVTEYALSWRSDRARHLGDAVGGLWAAEAALRLADAGVPGAYFALMGAGNHGLLDEAGFPRFSYAAFRELAHYRGERLDVQADDPRVWVHAARQGERVTLLVLNTSGTPLPLTTAWPGFTVIGAKAVTEEDVNADRPPRPLNVRGAVALPPLSVTRVVLAPAR